MNREPEKEWNDVLLKRSVSLSGAREVIHAAQRKAQENGWRISVAVVDRAGEVVALERNDAAIGISPTVALAKARTAALLEAPSGEFEAFINAGQPSFLATPGVTPLEGGIPLRFDGEIIGAVGVSGAHGANDSAVALAAAAALVALRRD
ncbi:GlcG/HbpS family heme-binding protein [Pantoea sp. B65]|uniref:GlcG/HbpS family heme-binding protein n=1 Tax=Pantoea sp. B65 TaxID=2813359 RepID=UPI0039B540EE